MAEIWAVAFFRKNTPPKFNMEPENNGFQMDFPGIQGLIFRFHVGVSKNRGTPKWMVDNGKPYSNG